MTRNLLRSAGAAILLTAAAGIAPGTAEEFAINGTFGWLGVGSTTPIEENRFYWVGHFSGTYLDRDESGPMHHSAWMCPGWQDIGTAAGGLCVMTDADGDKAFTKWECAAIAEAPKGAVTACEGTYTYTGGTGKYAGVTGGGPFTGVTVELHPNGTASGLALFREGKLVLAAR